MPIMITMVKEVEKSNGKKNHSVTFTAVRTKDSTNFELQPCKNKCSKNNRASSILQDLDRSHVPS